MKRILTTSAACLVAATLLAGTAASAQPYGHAYGHYNHGEYRHDDYRRNDDYRRDDRGYYRHNYRPAMYSGWHDRSDWRRGGYVARYDWDRGYAVDYRRYHLRRPPYGYQWRRVGDNYVLAAIASGLIADMIINSR